MIKFYLLEIINMKNQSQEIKLYFEFDLMDVKLCNFNKNGEFVLFCMSETSRGEKINIVYVYSVQTEPTKTKYQKIYKIPKEAEVINISKDDEIWLHFNNDIYE